MVRVAGQVGRTERIGNGDQIDATATEVDRGAAQPFTQTPNGAAPECRMEHQPAEVELRGACDRRTQQHRAGAAAAMLRRDRDVHAPVVVHPDQAGDPAVRHGCEAESVTLLQLGEQRRERLRIPPCRGAEVARLLAHGVHERRDLVVQRRVIGGYDDRLGDAVVGHGSIVRRRCSRWGTGA